MSTFGIRLRTALRTAGDGTPKQLAVIGGFSETTARKWLAMDIARVDAMNLARVARALNVSMYWLIWDDGLVTGMGALRGDEKQALLLLGALSAQQRKEWLEIGTGLS